MNNVIGSPSNKNKQEKQRVFAFFGMLVHSEFNYGILLSVDISINLLKAETAVVGFMLFDVEWNES